MKFFVFWKEKFESFYFSLSANPSFLLLFLLPFLYCTLLLLLSPLLSSSSVDFLLFCLGKGEGGSIQFLSFVDLLFFFFFSFTLQKLFFDRLFSCRPFSPRRAFDGSFVVVLQLFLSLFFFLGVHFLSFLFVIFLF